MDTNEWIQNSYNQMVDRLHLCNRSCHIWGRSLFSYLFWGLFISLGFFLFLCGLRWVTNIISNGMWEFMFTVHKKLPIPMDGCIRCGHPIWLVSIQFSFHNTMSLVIPDEDLRSQGEFRDLYINPVSLIIVCLYFFLYLSLCLIRLGLSGRFGTSCDQLLLGP